METIIVNGEEYQQYYDENGHRVWYQERNKRGFKIKMTMVGTKEDEEEFKRFVVDLVSKAWINNEPWILNALEELRKRKDLNSKFLMDEDTTL